MRGYSPLVSRVYEHDLFRRELMVTEVAVAHELARAVSHLMGRGVEEVSLVFVRGTKPEPSNLDAGTLIRARRLDLFH